MLNFIKFITVSFFLIFVFFNDKVIAENDELTEILDAIQKDIKTLEKAVILNRIILYQIVLLIKVQKMSLQDIF